MYKSLYTVVPIVYRGSRRKFIKSARHCSRRKNKLYNITVTNILNVKLTLLANP